MTRQTETTGEWIPCAECQAPLEPIQRYCVRCGARQLAADNPAARYFSDVARRRRAPGAVRPPRRGTAIGVAALLAALPLAVAAGVLIGHSGSHSDKDLLAALRNQKPTVVNVGDGTAGGGGSGTDTTATTAVASTAALSSDFPLQQGFTVELQTLPSSSDAAAVDAARSTASGKGAKGLGIIVAKDFTLTPSASGVVLYAGAYRTRAQAQAALGRLHASFPDAKVVAVRATGAGSGSSDAVVATGVGGTAHRVEDAAPPSALQVEHDRQVVRSINSARGQNYVNAQRDLPDVIEVPDGTGGPSAPQGAGQP